MNPEVFATYTYPNFANRSKISTVFTILKEYRQTAKNLLQYLWSIFYRGGKLPYRKSLNVKHIQSNLSERYKYVCLWQVYGIFDGYISNLQYQFANMVWRSNLLRDEKLILLALNNLKSWLKYDKDTVIIFDGGETKSVQLTQEHRRLAKKIFKHLVRINREPRIDKISMHLDKKVCDIVGKQPDKAKLFDYWLKLSTLERGNPIYIPLNKNTYAESLEGKFKNFYQIVEKNEEIVIKRVKELSKREYIPLTDKISIDIGLNPLFASNKGDLIGRKFIDFLKILDEKITSRMRILQKNGIKPKQDNRYVKLINRLRDFLKNEINRLLNNIIKLYRPKQIVIERLDFRSPKLSRRLNRLIQNFGKRYIKEKLRRLKGLYNVEIIEINPAYTSQECSSCGYIDKRNRKDIQTFKCKVCGNKINAQVNGAKNILNRSSINELGIHLSKKKVLKMLVERYLEKYKGCKSAALDTIVSNPYFKDYLGGILNPGRLE
jgi:putative transposase